MQTVIPRMATLQQASEQTGLAYSCLRKWCINDVIVYRKIGSKYLINMDRLAEYLNGEEVEGGAVDT